MKTLQTQNAVQVPLEDPKQASLLLLCNKSPGFVWSICEFRNSLLSLRKAPESALQRICYCPYAALNSRPIGGCSVILHSAKLLSIPPGPYEASPFTAAGARFSRSSYVRATRVCRGLLDFRVNLASNEDSRAREIQPQQQRNHRLHFRIGPLG
jgi:hypothetical protein